MKQRWTPVHQEMGKQRRMAARDGAGKQKNVKEHSETQEGEEHREGLMMIFFKIYCVSLCVCVSNDE